MTDDTFSPPARDLPSPQRPHTRWAVAVGSFTLAGAAVAMPYTLLGGWIARSVYGLSDGGTLQAMAAMYVPAPPVAAVAAALVLAVRSGQPRLHRLRIVTGALVGLLAALLYGVGLAALLVAVDLHQESAPASPLVLLEVAGFLTAGIGVVSVPVAAAVGYWLGRREERAPHAAG